MAKHQKILSQSGISLADNYNVQGSIVEVDELDSHEVKTVHEMGNTMFSERFSCQTFVVDTGALLQNITFGIGPTADLPDGPSRILAIIVTTSVTARILHATVSMSSIVGTIEEQPIWSWVAGGGETVGRFVAGGVSNNIIMLDSNPSFERVPLIRAGSDQPRSVPGLVLRGITSGFGAGTVTIELRVLVAFADVGGISSYGLPFPSW